MTLTGSTGSSRSGPQPASVEGRDGSGAPRPSTGAHGSPEAREWIGLEEAGRSLGVSATTLRRWADAGIVRTFVTPGGHRRFDGESVRAMLPRRGGRPTLDQLGETPERMRLAYDSCGDQGAPDWIHGLAEEERSGYRERGRAMIEALLRLLDAPTDEDRRAQLAAATEIATHHGWAARQRGLPIIAVVEAFQLFRRPFVRELAEVSRARRLDVDATAELMLRASDAFDELLASTLRAFDCEPMRAEASAGAAAGGRRGRRSSTDRQPRRTRPGRA